jgi:hypothetical protein
MTRRAITLVALVCALSAGAPALAGAASGGSPSQAITDCNDHGQLTGHYSASTLRTALAQMPADVREYTNCYDVIERQLFKQLGTVKPGSTGAVASSSGSFLPTWLLVVIVVLALAAVTFGALAIRRRTGGPGSPGPGSPGSGDPGGPADPPPPA